MRQSVLFSRFFAVVILAILITALFTTIFYNYISRTVFTTIKENELLPKAKALGSIVQSFREGGLDKGALKQLLAVEKVDSSLLGAYVLVTDEDMNTLLINERYGNRLTLGAILTDCPFPADPPTENLCPPNCQLCMKSCPAQAIEGGHVRQKLCRMHAYGKNVRGFDTVDCNVCRAVCPMRVGKRA